MGVVTLSRAKVSWQGIRVLENGWRGSVCGIVRLWRCVGDLGVDGFGFGVYIKSGSPIHYL